MVRIEGGAKRRGGRRSAACLAVAAFLLLPQGGTTARAASGDPVAHAELFAEPAVPERSIGRADAPVVVVEYASATCGHCARFSVEQMPEIRRELVDKGLVRFVFREFPLDPRALAASMVSRCAPEEKFFPIVEDFFERQQEWAFAENALPPMLEIAAKYGIDRPAFEKCVGDEALMEGIRRTKEAGARLGVGSTPSFFVDGRLHQGSMTAADMIALVRDAADD